MVLRTYSLFYTQESFLEDMEDFMGYWGLNLCQLFARQTPYPLYNCCSLSKVAFIVVANSDVDSLGKISLL